MALKLCASADERREIVLACDESIQAVNTQEQIEALRAGEASDSLVIPDDATRVVIRPLNTPSWQAVLSAAPAPAGVLPPSAFTEDGGLSQGEAKDAQSAIEAHILSLPAEEQPAALAQLGHWNTQFNLAICELGLESVDALGDTVPYTQGGLRRFPRAAIERLPLEAIGEIAEAIARISQMGKADSPLSGRRSGLSGSTAPNGGGGAKTAKARAKGGSKSRQKTRS
jgi:hypothetical protein